MFIVRYKTLQRISRYPVNTKNRTKSRSTIILAATPTRQFSHTPPDSHFLHLTELTKCGATKDTSYTLDELTSFLKKDGFNLNLPIRDLKIFFRNEHQSKCSNSVLVRPDSKCFLMELEQLRIICFPDKCLVLNPYNRVVGDFIDGLKKTCVDSSSENIGAEGRGDSKESCKQQKPSQEFYNLLVSNIQNMDFEHVVLEQALNHITSRFSRFISLTRPALELLLKKITQEPSGSMMRRLLAFRKSLGEFELNVRQVKHAIDDLLLNDEDMVALYLNRSGREIHQHQGMERLLEAYAQVLGEILDEIQNLRVTVDETNQFIDSHLSSVRNSMIEMGIFMEMGSLSLGVGACAAGIFGMNFQHGLEKEQYAFFVVSGGLVMLMAALCGGLFRKYYRTIGDTSSAHSFKALKNFFQYVDELDAIIEAKGQHHFTRSEFRGVLNKLTGTEVTKEESKFIFQMFDADKDGLLRREEIQLGDDKSYEKGKSG